MEIIKLNQNTTHGLEFNNVAKPSDSALKKQSADGSLTDFGQNTSGYIGSNAVIGVVRLDQVVLGAITGRDGAWRGATRSHAGILNRQSQSRLLNITWNKRLHS